MADWIYVVDNDSAGLRLAEETLEKSGMRVSAFSSGRAMLEAGETEKPDLILLAVSMPEMNGFETLSQLQRKPANGPIPFIFLTENDDADTVSRGTQMGAMDFIRKPFIPDVLVLRVQHAIELSRARQGIAAEAAKKTKEIKRLSMEIVHSLAEAIDAKDAYTHGHSQRVAKYSREIARRYGFDEDHCDNIYMMGLLHDVGKIGIPDEVINKPGRLTDEEFAVIKTHPSRGSRILDNIEDMPMLDIGAHFHHERYDGRGYPEGLKGKRIPVTARIIAVADAYDAMTSNRSYRGVMPQAKVRAEIEKGKGTQFDPAFAEIMTQLIDEDTEYTMHG